MNESYARFLHSKKVLEQSILVKALREAQASGQPLNQILIGQQLLAPDRASLYWTYFQDSLQTMDGANPPPMLPSTLSGSQEPIDSDKAKTPSPLDKYRILGEINRGGMGVIYRARHRESNDDVIIKTPLKEKNPESTILERFDREAKTLARLSHPNIVKISDYGRIVGQPFFVMEFIRGENLEEIVTARLKKNKDAPDYKWLANTFSKIAEALSHCHRKGIVHRDLKPSNILVEYKTNRPVLVDFGLVKKDMENAANKNSDASADVLTKTGEVIGTPAFMAPEQLNPKQYGKVTEASDVWSLGATLFFCMTGNFPYEVQGMVQLFGAMSYGPPRSASSIDSNVPNWLNTLCARCMEREPSKRLSAEQVARILKDRRKARFNWTKKHSFISLAFLAVLFIVILASYLINLRDSVAPVLQLQSTPDRTRSGKFLLIGRIDDERPSLLLVKQKNRKKTEYVDPDGGFRIPLSLVEGENRFSLIAMDQDGNQSEPKIITIQRDNTAPEVTFKNLEPTTYVDTFTLEGQLNEANCSITAGKNKFKVSGKNFKIPLPLKFGKNLISVVIADSQGNVLEQTIKIRRIPFIVVGYVKNLSSDPTANYADLDFAIEKAPARCRILVGPGRHKLSREIRKELEIVGQGPRDKVILESSHTGQILVLKSPRVHLKNLTFKARTEKSGPISAISVNSGTAIIENCLITNDNSTGITLIGSNSKELRKTAPHLTIKDSQVSECGGRGILANQFSQLEIFNSTIKNNRHNGIQLQTGSTLKLKNSLVENNRFGIELTLQAKAVIQSTKILKCRGRGLTVSDRGSSMELEDVIVQANGMENSNSYGICVESEARARLIRTTISETKGIGLRVVTGAFAELKTCVSKSNRQIGIYGGDNGSTINVFDSMISKNGTGVCASMRCRVIIVSSKIQGNLGHGLYARESGIIQYKKCQFSDNRRGKAAKAKGGLIVEQ
ncbi:MAG: protein kinase [Planctomycetota bacterium]|nr:protein kinase [Planctomycetota bacterium]